MKKIDQKLQSVSDQVLEDFLKSLSSEKGLEEISNRLRNIILEEKTATEKNLHKAIFEEEIQ